MDWTLAGRSEELTRLAVEMYAVTAVKLAQPPSATQAPSTAAREKSASATYPTSGNG